MKVLRLTPISSAAFVLFPPACKRALRKSLFSFSSTERMWYSSLTLDYCLKCEKIADPDHMGDFSTSIEERLSFHKNFLILEYFQAKNMKLRILMSRQLMLVMESYSPLKIDLKNDQAISRYRPPFP